MLRRAIPRLVTLALIGGAAWIAWDRGFTGVITPIVDPTSEAAFDAWVDESPQRRAEFAGLQAFLINRDVADIVPAWQLTRIDLHYAQRCDLPVFRIPPQDLWENVVPALRLVRDEVVPAVGPVQVLSSFRTSELNRCAGGASGSNHLRFEALDLATAPRRNGLRLYEKLCEMHDIAGPGSAMGLGAYYDFADPSFGGGRFHIDASGYRDWGRGYTSARSPCRRF